MTNGEKFKEVFGFGADGSRVIAVNKTWWDCDFKNSKPITNADRIRNMDDYDLAIFLENVSCKYADTESWLEWLRQVRQEVNK